MADDIIFTRHYYFSDKIELSVLDITRTFIDKVHADKRMRLFEYQISYTEL